MIYYIFYFVKYSKDFPEFSIKLQNFPLILIDF